MSVNKWIGLARLGTEPELKYTPSGAAVCNFSVATSEKWTDKQSGQQNEKTTWHRIVVWGKLAELCNQYLAKGRQVYIEGKIDNRSWDDQDGNKRYTTEINASTVQFIGGQNNSDSNYDSGYNQSGQQQSNNQNAGPSNPGGGGYAGDDIPFAPLPNWI